MADYIVFGRYDIKADRVDGFIAAFSLLIEHAMRNQKSIPCIFLLQNTAGGKSVELMTISCFENRQAYHNFLRSESWTGFHASFEVDVVKTPTQVEVVELATGFPYRSQFGMSHAFTVMASIQYEPGTREQGIKHWSKVTSYVELEEADTVSYCFLKSSEDENILYSFERYKNKKYFQQVHVPSQAIQGNIEAQKDIRTVGGLKLGFWKEIANSRGSS